MLGCRLHTLAQRRIDSSQYQQEKSVDKFSLCEWWVCLRCENNIYLYVFLTALTLISIQHLEINAVFISHTAFEAHTCTLVYGDLCETIAE